MDGLYGTGVSVDELASLDREAIVAEFVDDALDAYAEKEEEFGTDLQGEQALMRELERYVILQVVDVRWREHLESMEYLREGVHLRAMAQKDPLVEYTSEGHVMFEELNLAIREEVVSTLFHAQLAPEEVDALQPVLGDGAMAYEHESLAGADAIAAAGAGAAVGTMTGGGSGVATAGGVGSPAMTVSTGTRRVSEHEKVGRNDPCWCGSGKKFKKCHGA
jgi:preprotein translocase subunit SecA